MVFLLTPDESHPAVLATISSQLGEGAALGFACGFSLRFLDLPLPDDADVVMVSPKGPGAALRERFEAGGGLPALVAVAQDRTGRALETALSYAKAIGCGRVGIIESSFAEEAETDLFGEQAVLCGGIPKLMEAGFETLVEAGYSPEAAYIECIWEAKAIVDLIFRRGIEEMYGNISPAARYGGLTRGGRVVDEHVRERMMEVLEGIRDGSFAAELLEASSGEGARPELPAELEAAARRLRKAFGG